MKLSSNYIEKTTFNNREFSPIMGPFYNRFVAGPGNHGDWYRRPSNRDGCGARL